jgi:acetoin utilization protein AcuB
MRIDPGHELATEGRGTTVMDWMSVPPVVVGPWASVAEAGRLMREHRIRRLPVIDDCERLVGIVSERDLEHALGGRVSEVMTGRPHTVSPDTTLTAAARLMHTANIGALPVVVNGRVVGVLTRSDVNRAFVHFAAESSLRRAV